MTNLWYVIQTKAGREEEVRWFLSRKGLQIFCPFMEALSFRNGKLVKEVKSLFPSYLFGKFDLDQSYSLVKWARGVKKIVGFGGYPTPVADEVIELIMMGTDEDGVVKKERCFRPGDSVRIMSGPLKDLCAIFERWISERDRVRVLLNLIGYQPTLELHSSMLEKVA
jgi:transcriptional antiterminator NusG